MQFSFLMEGTLPKTSKLDIISTCCSSTVLPSSEVHRWAASGSLGCVLKLQIARCHPRSVIILGRRVGRVRNLVASSVGDLYASSGT